MVAPAQIPPRSLTSCGRASGERAEDPGDHRGVGEDNEDTRVRLFTFLHHCGASVVSAPTGAEALAACAEVRSDVIVSDLSMPGMTGSEFIGHLRDIPGQLERPTPAIAVMAFHHQITRRHALDSGFRVHLTKPFDPLTVVEEVERLYRESQDAA